MRFFEILHAYFIYMRVHARALEYNLFILHIRIDQLCIKINALEQPVLVSKSSRARETYEHNLRMHFDPISTPQAQLWRNQLIRLITSFVVHFSDGVHCTYILFMRIV